MKNPKVYVISDTHFGHASMIKFEPEARGHYKDIEEHDLDLLARWNSVVRPKDTVWHLGDVYFGEGWKVLPHLNGRKKLVLGNHDAGKEETLMRHFYKIFGIATFGDCILSHVPVHPYQLASRFKKNIHGHMHSKRVSKQDPASGFVGFDDRYVCVSVEHTDLKPVLLQHVIQHGL
jgi:calcineurin-like phosphoesterase family protein